MFERENRRVWGDNSKGETMNTTTQINGGVTGTIAVVLFVLWAVQIVSFWKVFTKAGQPGVFALIPIVNLVVLMKIVKRSGWFVLLFFIPLVNFVWLIVINIEVAKKFGKGAGFGILMSLVPIVGYPILGFGDAKYDANA